MIRLIIVLLLCTTTLFLFGQNIRGYYVKGNLSGLKNDSWIYLLRNNAQEDGSDTIARVQAKNGQFLFKTKAFLQGQFYFIKIDTFKTKYERQISGYITLLLEDNAKIELNGTVQDLDIEHILVTGSHTHDEYLKYFISARSQSKEITKLRKELYEIIYPRGDSAAIVAQQDKINELKDLHSKFLWEWIKDHPNHLFTPFLIRKIGKNYLEKSNAYSHLSMKNKASIYGLMLYEDIEMEKNTSIGTVAPNFSFPSVTGENLSLKEVVVKSELTILDFWASWCKPCRAEFPNLKRLYNKYHSRGLNILGYSVDENEALWKRAIQNDSLPWYNVRETEENTASKLYGVRPIPMTFLLDKNGKILAKGLMGEELEKMVEELMGKKGE